MASPDTSHLPWWLGPYKSPGESLLAGVQVGTAIRSNNLRAQQMMAESAQNMRREETATALKMMDLKMEGDRNNIALQTFNATQQAKKMKAESMLGLGNILGSHIKDQKLTDPEAQAEFWNYVAQIGGFVGQDEINSIWDNNYGSAMTRQENANKLEFQKDKADTQAAIMRDRLSVMQQNADTSKFSAEQLSAFRDANLALDEYASAETSQFKTAYLHLAEKKLKLAEAGGAGVRTTSAIQNSARETALRKAVADAKDPETKASAQYELDSFYRFAGVTPPGVDLTFKTVAGPDGSKHTYYQGRKGEPVFVKQYDPSRLSDSLKRSRFQSEMRQLEDMWKNDDPAILSRDPVTNKPFKDPEKLEALKARAWAQATEGMTAPEPEPQEEAIRGGPPFEYDPAGQNFRSRNEPTGTNVLRFRWDEKLRRRVPIP